MTDHNLKRGDFDLMPEGYPDLRGENGIYFHYYAARGQKLGHPTVKGRLATKMPKPRPWDPHNRRHTLACIVSAAALYGRDHNMNMKPLIDVPPDSSRRPAKEWGDRCGANHRTVTLHNKHEAIGELHDAIPDRDDHLRWKWIRLERRGYYEPAGHRCLWHEFDSRGLLVIYLLDATFSAVKAVIEAHPLPSIYRTSPVRWDRWTRPKAIMHSVYRIEFKIADHPIGRDPRPSYVGITGRDPHDRITEHLLDLRQPGRKGNRTCRKLSAAGFPHIAHLEATGLIREDAEEMERELIAKLRWPINSQHARLEARRRCATAIRAAMGLT